MSESFERIVLIADRIDKVNIEFQENAHNFEMISESYFYKVKEGLEKGTNKQVIHYNSPSEFSQNVNKHLKDIVFTIYGGEKSRNRMGLVPAICEANGIKFIGADVYARMLCQDKFMTTKFVAQFGINSAKGILIFSPEEIPLINSLQFPLVVKPNFEGSSIGITEKSLVKDFKSAQNVIYEILKIHGKPVLVEEFLIGSETCICVSGNREKVTMIEAIEVIDPLDPDYFNSHLYSAKVKHNDDKLEHRKIGVDKVDLIRIEKMFLALGKVDYMRVDGKVKDGKFRLIELTPDAYFGEGCAFEFAHNLHGKTYEDMLNSFIQNSLTHYHNPSPNASNN